MIIWISDNCYSPFYMIALAPLPFDFYRHGTIF